jgi:hypothetical protein
VSQTVSMYADAGKDRSVARGILDFLIRGFVLCS